MKDSFARLDLSAVGLEPLFDAHWFALRVSSNPPAKNSSLAWRRIVDAAGIEAWERAWRGADPNPQRIFLPELLSNPCACVLAGFDGRETIRAGGIAYEAAGVTGVTNIFGPRAMFVKALAARKAPTEIVCYERGPDLAAATNSASSEWRSSGSGPAPREAQASGVAIRATCPPAPFVGGADTFGK